MDISLVGDNYSKENGPFLALKVPRTKRRDKMIRDGKGPTVMLHNKLSPDLVLYSIYSHAPGSSSSEEAGTYRLFWDLG